MVGASLSRWTMSYFAFALLSLCGALVLMVSGYGFPGAAIAAPETLIVVHLVAIGWLSLLMCGALFQFVPVLVARPLYSDFLPLPTLACLAAGLMALLLGFLQLAGSLSLAQNFLPAAGPLLGLGFALTLWNLGRTLWSGRPLILPARFVAIGLASLAATAAFGLVFTLVLGGVSASAELAAITSIGVPLHLVAGLGGWLTFTAMGVSYRLLAMFMLAPDSDSASTRGALGLGAAALFIVVAGGLAAIFLSADVGAPLLAGAIFGIAALGLYGWDMQRLYRARKRRVIELNSRMAGMALANLAAAVVIGIGFAAAGELAAQIGALVFLVSFGWLTGLGLAKLYKIVAFITWLECYGPVLGKTPTPRVQDLVVETRAAKWFWLYFAGVWLATLFLVISQPMAFRAAAAIMLIGVFGIAGEVLRTRRLADVAQPLRLPQGTERPHLLISAPRGS